MKTLLQITALLAASFIAGAAVSQPVDLEAGAPGGHGPVQVMVIVSSHGLDPAGEAGAVLFRGRLATRGTRACDARPASGVFTLSRSQGFQACRAKALETAMAYVRSPLVRQRYAQIRTSNELRLAHR